MSKMLTLVDYPTSVYPSPVVTLDGVPHYPSIGGLGAYAHARGITVADVLEILNERGMDWNVWHLELEERGL